MMPILHIRNSDIFGSPERLIIGQMRHLTAFQSYCATFTPPGKTTPFLRALQEHAVAGIPIETDGQVDRVNISKLKTIIDTNQIQLLITHDYKANFYTYLANRKLNLPHIGYYHGRTDENLKVKLYNFIDTKILPRLDKIITVSKATSNYLIKKGIPKERIEVVFNALEIDDDFVATQKPVGSPPIIGVVGRLSHEKGIHIFLEVVAKLAIQLPQVKVWIFGDGPDREKLKKQTRTFHLDHFVTFKGFKSDLDEIYSQLDILVIPSLSEGHPLIILEAWKYAIGIVATKAGGVPEIIEHGRTGLLAEVNNPDSLGQMLLQALSDLTAVKEYGRNGLALLKERYSYATQAKQLNAIYKKVIKNKHESGS